jgi:TolB-like protein/Flp pilus assembly protein TadD
MLVVLPFENLGAPEDAYFAAGMTEEITSRLGRVRSLGVISRTSAVQYDRAGKTTKQIGEDLGVAFVLEGTVRWDRRSEGAGRVRITPQLIRVADDTHMWADSYDRVLDDIFEAQSEIAQAVVEQLGVTLLPEEQKRVEARPTESREAYEAYLKGQYHLDRLTPEGRQMGLQYLEQAIEIDPEYASAYAGLADYYMQLAEFGGLAPKEVAPQAKAAALKALELDDSLASAHLTLASVSLSYEWDWAAAEEALQQALKLNPSGAGVHKSYAHYLSAMGRYEEAVAEMRKAQRLDPLNPTFNVHVGWHLYWAREYDEAMKQIVTAIELDPNWWDPHYHLGQVYEQMGTLEEAIAELEQAVSLSRSPVSLAGLGHAYGLAGRREEAQRIALELEDESKRRYVPPYQIAAVYAGLGDRDEAFACLERAYDERDVWLTSIVREPMFDPLRSDPRFRDLLRRMNLPE